MRIHVYVHVDEFELLHKLIKGFIVEENHTVSISNSPFEDSYLVDICYNDYIRLKEDGVLISLISL